MLDYLEKIKYFEMEGITMEEVATEKALLEYYFSEEGQVTSLFVGNLAGTILISPLFALFSVL